MPHAEPPEPEEAGFGWLNGVTTVAIAGLAAGRYWQQRRRRRKEKALHAAGADAVFAELAAFDADEPDFQLPATSRLSARESAFVQEDFFQA